MRGLMRFPTCGRPAKAVLDTARSSRFV
jgi:hypothetical protein